jgi:hypothetical protein
MILFSLKIKEGRYRFYYRYESPLSGHGIYCSATCYLEIIPTCLVLSVEEIIPNLHESLIKFFSCAR